ncbi:pleckstrin homology-like domain family B member 1 [Littorina saxatilis]|uniref:pleckstrin homology-like domain family B member 1 n=1 Tax=Littorina saxatilis TaxID=31220 RepID=UPI0038B66ED9
MPVNEERPPGQSGKLVMSDQLEVTQVDKALRVQTEEPHLVSMGGGRLSTAVTIHPLPEGITKIGTKYADEPQDVLMEGTGIGDHHCYIENLSGVITLHPIAALCAIDGKLIIQPTRLAQGSMVVLGRSNYFRYNHPQEARKMKEAMNANQRISCVPLQFLHGQYMISGGDVAQLPVGSALAL